MPSSKTLSKATRLFLSKLYSDSYRNFFNERDIDIAGVSKCNLQRLYQLLKNRAWLPEAEKHTYGDKIFNLQEFALWEIWQNEIVPLFTLKHATKAVNFDVLAPINKRLKQGDIISQSNTGGTSADRGFSYFVLGISDKHSTPKFLGANVDTILLRLGKIQQQEQASWRGLWIGSHLKQYYDEAELDPVTFGNTTRTIKFNLVDGKPGIKTYFYKRSDGTVITRKCNYQDEIFAADQNLNTIFDALFFQFVIELRLIGGEFQQYVFDNANNIETITTIFHTLFQSWVYPEAHLPNRLPLSNNTYTEVIKKPDNYFQLTKKWFDAAKKLDIKKLLECINQGIDINLLNQDNENALIAAIKNESIPSKDLVACVELLIAHGSDITIRTIFGESLLDLAIKKNLLNLIEEIFEGISHHKIPSIKYHINVNKSHIKSQNALITCANSGNLDAFNILFNYGIKIESDLPILNAVYCSHTKTDKKIELIKLLVAQGANLEAIDNKNKTVLHQAAANKDHEMVDFLLAMGANINATIGTGNDEKNIDENAGRTALHLAVLAGAKEVLEILLNKRARTDIIDEWGDTAYFLLIDELTISLERYIKKNHDLFTKFRNIQQVISPQQSSEGMLIQCC